MPETLNEKALPARFIEEYAEGYELRADEGDYTPTEAERALLIDFGHGLLSEIEDRRSALPAGDYAGLVPVAWRARHSEQENWYLHEAPVGWWECQALVPAEEAATAIAALVAELSDWQNGHANSVRAHAEALARAEAAEARRARTEDSAAVKVKPLEWHEKLKQGEREGFVCSEGGALSYSIMLSRFRVYGLIGEHDGAAEFSSLDEAKAAAQSDYERRILSALSSSPQEAEAVAQFLSTEDGEFNGDEPWEGPLSDEEQAMIIARLLSTHPPAPAVTEAMTAKQEAIDMLVQADDVWTDYGSGFRVHFSFPPNSNLTGVVERINTARAALQSMKGEKR